MLIDLVATYNEEKKIYFRNLREKILLHLATQHDTKKIISFLQNVGIISIDEKEMKIFFGIPNEFVLSQVNKFFSKSIKEAVKNIYNEQFGIKFIIYTPFQKKNELLSDMKKLFNIKKKTEEKFEKTLKNELKNYFGILFEPEYTFGNFVVGANNNFAFSASKAVSENPGTIYNPLFLYGNVGLGKTHLMQAIGNYILKNKTDKVVVYLPTTKLLDEIILAIRKNKLSNLMKKLENVDILMIDDIQFLAGADKTQEIFHNIFNEFQMKKKQVIISSDRPPKELVNMEPRLKSRFSLGLVADIGKPDFETRIAILQTKLENKGEKIDFEILSIIAKYVKNNVRELEGALNILLTKKKLLNSDISEQDAYDSLKTLGYSTENDTFTNKGNLGTQNNKSTRSFNRLVELVAEYYNISVTDIKSNSRKKEITQSRQILMSLAKDYFNRTLIKIGDFFGGKNHASVIYAINNVKKKLKIDKDTSHDYSVFVDRIEK